MDDYAYRTGHRRMREGDVLCIVSDGLTEAANASGALYGPERVERTLASARTAREALDALARDVAAFAAGAVQSDDKTVLALQWRGPRAA
jgi:serine phosphatase RsbU (regulator of sigma subunit)